MSSETLDTEHASQWSVDDVCKWLNDINLSQYIETFQNESVDGSILLIDIDREMLLNELKIKRLHVGKMMREIKKLKHASYKYKSKVSALSMGKQLNNKKSSVMIIVSDDESNSPIPPKTNQKTMMPQSNMDLPSVSALDLDRIKHNRLSQLAKVSFLDGDAPSLIESEDSVHSILSFKKCDNVWDTIFHIDSCKAQTNANDDIIEFPLDEYWNEKDSKSWHWALFMFKRTYYRLCKGYFKILDEFHPSEKTCIDVENLNAFLYFVHHEKIRKYLDIKERQQIETDVTIYIDEQKYTLQFFNGKDIGQCQAFAILKHPSDDSGLQKDEIIDDAKENVENELQTKKKKKSKKIFALHFPKPYEELEWKWYDEFTQRHQPYERDPLQLLEFEATYYANIQSNFPKSHPNKLFRSNRDTSLFDHCYLPKFSELQSNQRYCMRYTLNEVDESQEPEMKIDQIRLDTSHPRNVLRYFDRQRYLESKMRVGIKQTLSRNFVSIHPMLQKIVSNEEDNGDIITAKQKIKWFAVFDTQPTENNMYDLVITSDFDNTLSSQFSAKTRKIGKGMEATYVNIKEAELVTNRCFDNVWAIFKKKKSKMCKFTNGFWDLSFDTNEKYVKLRQHVDAILTSLQFEEVHLRYGIDNEKGVFLSTKTENREWLRVTIHDDGVAYQYEVIWYNTESIDRAQAICINRKVKDDFKRFYIMYFPKVLTHAKWQWYDNDQGKYHDYLEKNELLQLECSYLSNLDINFPFYSLPTGKANLFHYCIFSSFMKNHKISAKKLYILRFAAIEEARDQLIIEQIAYTNYSDYPRNVRRRLFYDRKHHGMGDDDSDFDTDPECENNGDIDDDDFGDELESMSAEYTEDVIERMEDIMIAYQKWLQTSNIDKKKETMVSYLEDLYQCEGLPKMALGKLINDFAELQRTINEREDPHEEFAKISDHLHLLFRELKFQHKSDKCICVQRTYRERGADTYDTEQYFGFSDKVQVVAQQLLDTYHCQLIHLYDDNVINDEVEDVEKGMRLESWLEEDEDEDEYDISYMDNSASQLLTSPLSMSMDDDNKENVSLSQSYLKKVSISMARIPSFHNHSRTSSLLKITRMRQRKYHSKTVYSTGFRFYYWKFYEHNNEKQVRYRQVITEPGNVKPDGHLYKLKNWYVKAAADNFQQEILAFGDNFKHSIGKSQYDEAMIRAQVFLESDECKAMKCTDVAWETQYGIKVGSVITMQHILALILYTSFTDLCLEFCNTFRVENNKESDDSVKKRHSKCAIWGRYLRECVEAFGLKLKKNDSKVPQTFYRGISKKFLFEKTILRFNSPLSTTIAEGVAENFALGNTHATASNSGGSSNGMILTLRPHWGDFPGNVRAFNCVSISEFPHEEEWLFVGGFEPLVIHNIEVLAVRRMSYKDKIQAMNNIHQIFEGLACKFKMNARLVKDLIDNRLRAKHEKKHDYMSQIFDFYCNDLKRIKISLSLMDQSYKKIVSMFMNKFHQLKLIKIFKIFCNCEKITISDGYNFEMAPRNMDYDNTILGVTERALDFVNEKKHSLRSVHLEFNEEIKDEYLKQYQKSLEQIGWKCEQKKVMNNNNESDDDDQAFFKLNIKKVKGKK